MHLSWEQHTPSCSSMLMRRGGNVQRSYSVPLFVMVALVLLQL